MQLSNEKLIELIQGGVFPAEHLEQLYNQNKKLIYKLINSTVGSSSPLENDLLQEGYIILCNCVKSFDLKQGIKFDTYFGNAIRWGIYEYTLSTGATIRIPVNLMGKVIKYKQLTASRKTEWDIIKTLKTTKAELESIKRIAQSSVISLDEPVKNSSDENISISDTIADTTSDFENDVINDADNRILYNLCKSILKPIEFQVINLRYWHGLTYKDIGERIGKSGNMTDQIRRNALNRLRKDRRINDFYEPYLYRHTGISEFNRTFTSSVEGYVLSKCKYSELLNSI